MGSKTSVVIAGLGEVGKPLFELISKFHSTVGVDISPPSSLPSQVDVLHVCFPFEIKDFVGEAARYIDLFSPQLTVINSTVGVGITRAIAERTGAQVVNSPVRGKHVRMLEELSHYTKFIGALNPSTGEAAAQHFQSVGLKTKVLATPEASELAKLIETTYFGVLVFIEHRHFALASPAPEHLHSAILPSDYVNCSVFLGEVPEHCKGYIPGNP